MGGPDSHPTIAWVKLFYHFTESSGFFEHGAEAVHAGMGYKLSDYRSFLSNYWSSIMCS